MSDEPEAPLTDREVGVVVLDHEARIQQIESALGIEPPATLEGRHRAMVARMKREE